MTHRLYIYIYHGLHGLPLVSQWVNPYSTGFQARVPVTEGTRVSPNPCQTLVLIIIALYGDVI